VFIAVPRGVLGLGELAAGALAVDEALDQAFEAGEADRQLLHAGLEGNLELALGLGDFGNLLATPKM